MSDNKKSPDPTGNQETRHVPIHAETVFLGLAGFSAAALLAILSRGGALPLSLIWSTICFGLSIPSLIAVIFVLDASKEKQDKYFKNAIVFGPGMAWCGTVCAFYSITPFASALFLFTSLYWLWVIF